MPGTLLQKLKIKTGDKLLAVNAPADFKQQMKELNVQFVNSDKAFNQIHWFVTDQAAIKKDCARITGMVKGGVICWIYYPKSTSGIQTDLTRDKGWDVLQSVPRMQWLSLISLDDTWSAFAIREQGDTAPKQVPDRVINQYITADRELLLPNDFKDTLKKDKSIQSYFTGLAFSHRKEYLEWIVSAKKEETRTARLQKMLEMLKEKKKNPSVK